MYRKNNETIYRYNRLPLLVLLYNDYWFEYILKKGNTFLLDKIIFLRQYIMVITKNTLQQQSLSW